MKHKLLSLIILSFFFFSCKKKENHDDKGPDCSSTPIKYITPEIANFKFKLGTYWVYTDPVNPIIDTMRVYSVGFDGLTNNQYCPDNKYEYYSFTVDKMYFGSNGYDVYSLLDDRLIINIASESQPGMYSSSSPKIDSVFIYDRYYKSVVVYNKGNYKYYFNSEYGLLKTEGYDNSGVLVTQKVLKDKFIVR